MVGFTAAHDRQRMESVIRRGVRFGYCTTNQAPHDCSLKVKSSVTANEFLTRMLYKDMY